MEAKTAIYNREMWDILSLGVKREDGKVFAHLSSQSRFVSQRNGKRPVQVCDWIDDPNDPITAYYREKTSGHGQPPPIPR